MLTWPHTNATTAPESRPNSAPQLLRRFQNRVSSTIGPNEAPNPAQANATRSRMLFDGEIASTTAMMAMTSTPRRPSRTQVLSLSVRLDPERSATILNRSSIRAEDVTTSCEEIVDMIAARTAASTRPAMNGWNRIWARSRKTVSESAGSISACWEKYEMPTMAVATAPSAEMPIQPTPILRARLASAGVRSAMNRTMIWGWPKYPSPHARDEITVK